MIHTPQQHTRQYDLTKARETAAKFFRAKLAAMINVTAVYWGTTNDFHVARIVGEAYGRTIALEVPIITEELIHDLDKFIPILEQKIMELWNGHS